MFINRRPTVLRLRYPGIASTTMNALINSSVQSLERSSVNSNGAGCQTMININHPKIRGKPPVKRSVDESKRKTITEEKHDLVCTKKSEGADYNQNVIESTTSTFEQLCCVINNLERDIVGNISEIDQLKLQPERDKSRGGHQSSGTIYDDILTFLATLEDDSPGDQTKINMPEVEAAILGEILNNPDEGYDVAYDSVGQDNIRHEIGPACRDDLATAQLELEEKNAAIVLLKEQLKSERKTACEKLNAQRKSNAANTQQLENKYNGVIKRHQKFIEQLISEKTDLTEKCNSLAQRTKEIELKMQRDLKTAADRHTVELQRAKEYYAATEKVKRERWIENRTSRIKEMTVKGLEPELRSMMEQHAEEIQRLRNVHMKELQDTELRIIRQSNMQLEQLRLELTASHERMLTNEKNVMWTRYQEKLEEQENQFKQKQIEFVNESRYNTEKFNQEQAERDAEWEVSLQRMQSQYQRELDSLRQRQEKEKKAFQESLKTEWEVWLADYKKQQNIRMEQAEDKIRDECNRERDRQIELVIERLEKESRTTKLSLEQNFDSKLRFLSEKYNSDLQTAQCNVELKKKELIQTIDRLEKTQVQLQETENKLQKCISELNNANEVIKRLGAEQDNAKRLARQEIEGEKRVLEEKIASLYQEITCIHANRDSSMAQLHSRIRLVMTQKLLTIKNLNKKLIDANSKCEHLEKLLDQQRREYILNGL